MGELLAGELGLDDQNDVRFINDADAFLLGEWWAGAVRQLPCLMGVTLGTGLGSAFLRDGRIVDSGPDVPPQARLDLVPYRGRPAEHAVSSRALLARLGPAGGGLDVAGVAERARAGDQPSLRAFRETGGALGSCVAPWMERFVPHGLVIGGGMAHAWDLMSAAFIAACPPAARLEHCGVGRYPESAPLLGAACHAMAG